MPAGDAARAGREALAAYKDALRSKNRNPDPLRAARCARGRLYLDTGKKAKGRKELEKVHAEDLKFRDVADLLAEGGLASG